ncbi:MAG: hypothetical protein AAGA85_00905 [Bacteroidota bacterium]
MTKFFFITSMILLTAAANAQDFKIGEKVYVGGGLGFNINNQVTSFSISPYAAYKLTDKLSSGLRFTYQYTRFQFSDDRITAYGFGPFVRYQIAGPLFGWAEYEYLRFDVRNPTLTTETATQSFNSVFVGGGLSQPLGRTAGLNFMVLYNVTYGDGVNQPYNSPIVVRAGIDVGF